MRWCFACVVLVLSCGGKIDPAQDPDVLCAENDDVAAPQQFVEMGASPSDYEVGADPLVRCGVPYAHYVKSTRDTAPGYGGFSVSYDPAPYAGRTVRLEAVVKTEAVENVASPLLQA